MSWISFSESDMSSFVSSPSFSRFFIADNASLRTFLIAMGPFSASALAFFVKSMRDSSVSGGMIILITSPATVGFIPRSDF